MQSCFIRALLQAAGPQDVLILGVEYTFVNLCQIICRRQITQFQDQNSKKPLLRHHCFAIIQTHPLALLSLQDDGNGACWPNFLANFDIKIITSLTPSYWATFGVFRNIVHLRMVHRRLGLFYLILDTHFKRTMNHLDASCKRERTYAYYISYLYLVHHPINNGTILKPNLIIYDILQNTKGHNSACLRKFYVAKFVSRISLPALK